MTNAPFQIEIFTDFVCPWCYLATGVVERLQQQLPLAVTWSPYPLHPGTPPEGMLLSDMLPGMDLEAAHRRLYALMDDLGLEHGERHHTYNSRLAQELALWAQTQAGGAALAPLIYRAYFVHNRNLADQQVLLDLVATAGLDVAAATAVLRERSFSKAVDKSWARARQIPISGVPTFLAGGYQLTGFHPLADLQRFVEFAKAKGDNDQTEAADS
jgi:predicted DsbA family dithiol-disulfide isomerase